MNKPIKYFPVIFLLIIVSGLMIFWVIEDRNEFEKYRSNALVQQNSTNCESIINGYKSASKIYFQQNINTQEVISIFSVLSEADTKQKKQHRIELYNSLSASYKNLQQHGFNQLHFHKSNGESFLRFSRPNSFGDNLNPYRFSIEKIRKTRQPVSGIEAGRTNISLRFVYPLLSENDFIGSVEICMPCSHLKTKIEEIEKTKSIVLFKKEIIENHLFQDAKKTYKPLKNLPGYVWEQSDSKENRTTILFFEELGKTHTHELQKGLSQNTANVVSVKFNNKYYDIIFKPLPNIQGNQTGNLISIKENNYAKEINQKTIFKSISILVLFTILLVLILGIIKREKKIYTTSQKYQHAKIQLTESNEIKNRLFEIITHDLRNHFNAVNGFAELLRKQKGDEEKTTKLMTGLNDAILLTNNLMNNLFFWSRIQINKIELNVELFEVTKWLDKEIKKFSSIIQRKEVTVTNKTKGPVYIKGDIDAITFIFRNILHNAIRFTNKKGKIEIAITDDTKKSTIVIQDDGIGMDKNEIAKILKKDNWTGSRKEKDIGLGLLVTRKLIEKHNGTFSIESNKALGTKVTVEIPKK